MTFFISSGMDKYNIKIVKCTAGNYLSSKFQVFILLDWMETDIIL